MISEGTPKQVEADPASLTGQYLAGQRQIEIPEKRREPRGELVVKGARQHNLKKIDVPIPLGVFCCVTGVSGSGKSTLINETLYPAVANRLHQAKLRPGAHDRIEGIEQVDKIINIDQSPIGRTPRSNPATYTNVFDHIRQLYAQTREARARGYKPGRFSFNVKGGRCEVCRGDGQIKIEMHFLPDVYVPCEQCHGKRYNRETLEVRFKGKSIADVLEMSVADACEFFKDIPKIARRLDTLHDVGLDYIRLGQPATQLSGGEAQRVKLATELSKVATGDTLYILDEPTTGLHFADVQRLLDVLDRLVEAGNTVIVIEHNLDVIKTADRIIDLGPEGGEEGGDVLATGTPEQVAATPGSYTGEFLAGLVEPRVKATQAGKRKAAGRRLSEYRSCGDGLASAQASTIHSGAALDTAGQRAGLILLAAMLLSFGFIRFSTRMIRAEVSWWPGNVTPGRPPHPPPGLRDRGDDGRRVPQLRGSSPAIPGSRSSPAVFGVGMGLTLDEFALWLYLEDVYWAEEGRSSVDAVIFAAIIGGGLDRRLRAARRRQRRLDASRSSPTSSSTSASAALVALKGKYSAAVIGMFIAPVAWVAAIRLAGPGSWWAKRRYKPGSGKLTKAQARKARHDRRVRRFQDLIGGAPSLPSPRAPDSGRSEE